MQGSVRKKGATWSYRVDFVGLIKGADRVVKEILGT